MSLHPEVVEAIYDMCAIRDMALMNGAMPDDMREFTKKLADEILAPPFVKHLPRTSTRRPNYVGPLKPYKPRYDPALATPRLPEREWLPLVGKIMRRDGKTCRYCKTTEGRFCVDHVVPLSRGGSNNPDNLVVACIPCNSSKNDRLLSEWRGLYQ